MASAQSLNNSFSYSNIPKGRIITGLSPENVSNWASVNISALLTGAGTTARIFVKFGATIDNLPFVSGPFTVLNQTPLNIQVDIQSKFYLVVIDFTETDNDGSNIIINSQLLNVLSTSGGGISGFATETTQTQILSNVANLSDYIEESFSFNQQKSLWVAVDGSILVGNFPENQTVSGSISIDNLPEVQSVSVLNMPNDYANSGNQLAELEKLTYVANKQGNIVGDAYFSIAGPTIWADTNPIPTANKYGDGWMYKNTGLNQAMNFYYVSGLAETNLTLSSITAQYAVITNNSSQWVNRLILARYSQPQGSGGWYTSRITYSNYSAKMAPLGKYLVYWGNLSTEILPQYERINLNNQTNTGPCLGNEPLLSCSLASDSQSSAGQVDITVELLGAIVNGVSRTLYLKNDNNDFTLLSNVSTQLNKLTFTNNNLNVNANFSGSSIQVSNFPQVQPVSGSVSVSNITKCDTDNIGGSVSVSNLPQNQVVSNVYLTNLSNLDCKNSEILSGITTLNTGVSNSKYQCNITNANLPVSNVNLDCKLSEVLSGITTLDTAVLNNQFQCNITNNQLDVAIANTPLAVNLMNPQVDSYLYANNGSNWGMVSSNSSGYLNISNPYLEKLSNSSGGSSINVNITNPITAYTQKTAPTVITVIENTPLTTNTGYGLINAGEYSSFDILALCPAQSVSSGGSLFEEYSPDAGQTWYKSFNSVYLQMDNQNTQTYFTNVSNFSTQWIRLKTDNMLTTLSSIVVKISFRK